MKKKAPPLKSSPARDFLKKFVIDYVTKNLNKLKPINPDVNDDLVSDIENKPYDLNWVLFEVLPHDKAFKKLGIIVKSDWIDDTFETIYKIGSKTIRLRFINEDIYLSVGTYEFVKLVKKKVVVYEYEPVTSKK